MSRPCMRVKLPHAGRTQHDSSLKGGKAKSPRSLRSPSRGQREKENAAASSYPRERRGARKNVSTLQVLDRGNVSGVPIAETRTSRRSDAEGRHESRGFGPHPLGRASSSAHHGVVGHHENDVLGPDAFASSLEVGSPHVAVGHLNLAHLAHHVRRAGQADESGGGTSESRKGRRAQI